MAAPQPSTASSPASLSRAVGRWDLTALGINQVIVGAIFVVPAPIAAEIGAWSPLGFILAGFADWSSTAVTLFLALTGSFILLAGVSAIARLITYAGVSLATLQLRKRGFPSAAFVLPFGAAIPVAATAIALAMIAGATREQLTAGALALAAGAILYLFNARVQRSTGRRVP